MDNTTKYLDDTREDSAAKEWAKVREIAETDPVQGGTYGVDNEQAVARMKRTEYLKMVVEQTRGMIKGSDEYDEIIQRLAALDVTREAQKIEHLERVVAALMLELDAQNMYPDADAIFVENFDNPDQIDLAEVRVSSVVSADDSIDVESADNIVVGAYYTLTDGENMELVQVKAVHNAETTHRVILESNVTRQYAAGRTKLYRSSVAIYDGKCYGGGNTKVDKWEPNVTWQGESTSREVSTSISFADSAAFETDGVTLENGVLTLGSEVVGLAQIAAGNTSGRWAHIDANGDDLASVDFNTIYPWAGMEEATIDGQTMIRIPRFYFKRGTAPQGSPYEGKPCLWISDRPRAGFHIHPAFMYRGEEKPCFYIGAYEASADGTKAASKKNTSPLVSINTPTMITRCTNRNTTQTGDTAGWHLENIYEVGAVNMLLLVELATTDSQGAIGSGNVNSSAAVKSGTTNAAYRGIHEWWGNVWEIVDGLKGDGSSKALIFDNQGNGTYVPTGIIPANGSGWQYMVNMHETVGENYDLSAVFIPSTVNGTAANGTYADGIYGGINANFVLYRGGDWGLGAYAGAFALDVSYAASVSFADIGGRLAKYVI